MNNPNKKFVKVEILGRPVYFYIYLTIGTLLSAIAGVFLLSTTIHFVSTGSSILSPLPAPEFIIYALAGIIGHKLITGIHGITPYLVGIFLFIHAATYFLGGSTPFELIALHPAITHLLLLILSVRLFTGDKLDALIKWIPAHKIESVDSSEPDDQDEYGYNDDWEQNNLHSQQ